MKRIYLDYAATTPCDPEVLKAQLLTAGYAHVTQVVAPGEYCIRGGIIDLFPMGSALPYRIDLFDELDLGRILEERKLF